MGHHDLEAKIQGEREKGRKPWDHMVTFVLAAVGSAVGLGNVWRFPWLVSKYGGAPFLIPYFMILFLCGMPILGMELSIGTFFQAGDADAFGSMNPRLRGIGLASVFAGYAITFYYTIVLAWAGVYFVESFQSTVNIPWIGDVKNHFADVAMSEYNIDAEGNYDFTGEFNWRVFVSLMVMWVFIFFAIFKGVDSTGWVVKFTVPFPLLILIVLIIRGAFLEGAGEGIKNYLIKWDSEVLNDPYIWTSAIGQVFFSLGICMGVMTTYSSHNNKETTNVALAEKIISLSDTGIALMGGFAIYEMLGFMQTKCIKKCIADGAAMVIPVTRTEEWCTSVAYGTDQCKYYSLASSGLAFMAYPEGMATLEAPQFWGILFFGCLIMLGIDSAFSLAEVMVTFVKDCWIGLRYRPANWKITLVCCIIGFLGGFLYVFDSGYIMLDILDNYINNWGMVLIGCMECFAMGWVYKIDKQYDLVGKTSVMVYNCGYMGSLALGTILGICLPLGSAKMAEGAALGVGLAIFFIGWIISICVALVVSESSGSLGLGGKLWAIMGWWGADELRIKANNCVRDKGKDGVWVPNTWKSEWQALYRHDCFSIAFGFLIKYFSYSLLLVITAINIRNDCQKAYGGYPQRLLAVGQLTFAFMMFLVIMVAVFPRIMYDPDYSGKKRTFEKIKWMFTPKPADDAAIARISAK